jgi:hypothetical protein
VINQLFLFSVHPLEKTRHSGFETIQSLFEVTYLLIQEERQKPLQFELTNHSRVSAKSFCCIYCWFVFTFALPLCAGTIFALLFLSFFFPWQRFSREKLSATFEVFCARYLLYFAIKNYIKNIFIYLPHLLDLL